MGGYSLVTEARQPPVCYDYSDLAPEGALLVAPQAPQAPHAPQPPQGADPESSRAMSESPKTTGGPSPMEMVSPEGPTDPPIPAVPPEAEGTVDAPPAPDAGYPAEPDGTLSDDSDSDGCVTQMPCPLSTAFRRSEIIYTNPTCGLQP